MSSKLKYRYASSHDANDVLTLDDWLGIAWKTVAAAFEVICVWSVTDACEELHGVCHVCVGGLRELWSVPWLGSATPGCTVKCFKVCDVCVGGLRELWSVPWLGSATPGRTVKCSMVCDVCVGGLRELWNVPWLGSATPGRTVKCSMVCVMCVCRRTPWAMKYSVTGQCYTRTHCEVFHGVCRVCRRTPWAMKCSVTGRCYTRTHWASRAGCWWRSLPCRCQVTSMHRRSIRRSLELRTVCSALVIKCPALIHYFLILFVL